MFFAIAAGITLLVLLYFFCMPKFRSTDELIVTFLTIIFFYLSFISIVDVNLERINVSEDADKLLAFRLLELFVYPTVMTGIVDRMKTERLGNRLVTFVVGLCFLAAVEWWQLSMIVNYNDWHLGFAAAGWIVMIALGWCGQFLYNKIYVKGSVNSG